MKSKRHNKDLSQVLLFSNLNHGELFTLYAVPGQLCVSCNSRAVLEDIELQCSIKLKGKVKNNVVI